MWSIASCAFCRVAILLITPGSPSLLVTADSGLSDGPSSYDDTTVAAYA